MLLTFEKSAFRHGVSKDEVEEVLADPATEEFALEPSNQGNYRVMYVGFTIWGRLLEVGIECIHSPNQVFLHIFHANKVSRQFRSLFKEAKGK